MLPDERRSGGLSAFILEGWVEQVNVGPPPAAPVRMLRRSVVADTWNT
jgi:hypothetical protein